MADHFYTTDPNGELAMNGGYWLEGIACHVLPNRIADEVSFYRWLNPNSGDHFYTTDPHGEQASADGYIPEGIACYVYPFQQQNTTPFFRWLDPNNGGHFYTTDPNGEQAPADGYIFEGTACYVYPNQEQDTFPLFRWLDPNSGNHFYTLDPAGEQAPAGGYIFEGTACYVRANQPSNLKEFYRWLNPNSGDHFYTLDPTGEQAPAGGYIFEGISCYVFDSPEQDTVSLFRWLHPDTGDHFYTTDPNGELAPSSGYISEGIACNVYPQPATNTVPLFRWWNPGGCQKFITVHFKSLLPINNNIRDFWINQFSAMGQLYMSGGISVRLGTIEDLSNNIALQPLLNLNIGLCNIGQIPTANQTALFANRNNAAPNDIVVYLLNTLIQTPAMMGTTLGCAAFPPGQPGCAIVPVGINTKWLAAHEVGHVLGLFHVCQFPTTAFPMPATPCAAGHSDSLMFPNVNWTNLPPNISNAEFQTMSNSNLSNDC